MIRDFTSCGECPFFKHEDADGNGWCQLRDLPNVCDARCFFLDGYELTYREAERVLHYHQKWRRYNGKKNMRMVNSTLLGKATDIAIRTLRYFIKNM